MKKIILAFMMAVVSINAFCQSHIDTYTRQHPRCYSMNAINTGSKICLSTDNNYLLVQVNINNPMVFMKTLMQGVTIYVDPTGKKSTKYAVYIPSAADVQDRMKSNAMNKSVGQNERPDIDPLINAMNQKGAIFDVSGHPTLLKGNDLFKVSLNKNTETITYTMLLPLNSLLKQKGGKDVWSIGIKDRGQNAVSQRAPMMNEGPSRGNNSPRNGSMQGARNGEQHGRDSKTDAKEIQKLMRKGLKQWMTFPFDKIINL